MAENLNIAGRLHSTATGNVVAGANEIYDDTKGKKQSVVNQETDASLADRYTKAETYNKSELNNMITTPNQQYVTVTATDQTTAATDVLPATGSADTVYRVGNWDGTQFDETVYSEYAWDGSQYVHLSTKTQIGEVFDISAYHATGGELAKYADLAAALGTNGVNVPDSLKTGGMRIQFVQSSDNKYVQFRLMSDEWSTNTDDWAIADESVYVENPEFVRVYIDKDNRILWAIKPDGTVYYGTGVPPQVIYYIQAKIDQYHGDDIVAFLDGLEEGDETLQQLLDTKVDKEEGKSLMDSNYASSLSALENPEYLNLLMDINSKILEGIKRDGTKVINEDSIFNGTIFHKGIAYSVISNEEYLFAYTDSEQKVLLGLKRNGKVYIGDSDFIVKLNELSGFKDALINNTYYKNRDKLNALANACRVNKFTQTSQDFQFLIVADHHAEDRALENAIEAVNGFYTIDCLIHTGDIEAGTYDASYANKFINILKSCKKPYLITVGNHDVGNTMFVYYGATHLDVYNSFVKPMVDDGILIGDGVSADSEYRTNVPYYYHDFKDRKVRVIVIYEYECPLDSNNAIKVEKVNPNDATEPDWAEYWEPTESYIANLPKIEIGQTYTYDANNPQYFNCGNFTGCSFLLKKTVTVRGGQYSDVIIDAGDVRNNTMPVFKCGRAERVIMQDQAEWLIDVLKSTPDGYGIVVSTHNPSFINGTNQRSLKFATDVNANAGNCSQLAMTTDVIAEIVNAFVHKSSSELKVVMSNSNLNWHGSTAAYLNSVHDDGTYCYKLNIDFSERSNINAYFGCFIGGHVHKDMLFKHNSFDGQYAINPICANTQPGNMIASADIARPHNHNDVSYDSLTVVSVSGEYVSSGSNRTLKSRIALSKIGNNKTIDGKDRDYEVIENTYQLSF